MVRILYLVFMFLNGINSFLKAERALVSTLQTVTKISEIVSEDHCMSIRMNAEMVNANKETVRKILHNELNTNKV